jgi:hypothetical protein
VPRREVADDVVIGALAGGATIAAAARVAHCSKRTVARRLRDDSFRAAVREARARILQKTADALAVAGQKAVSTLVALLDDPAASIRLAASRAVLEFSLRAREATDTEGRLAAIEAMVDRTTLEHRRESQHETW